MNHESKKHDDWSAGKLGNESRRLTAERFHFGGINPAADFSQDGNSRAVSLAFAIEIELDLLAINC